MNWPAEIVAAEARIRPHIRETPLERSHHLSSMAKANVFLKLENLQETGSFKFRGATHKVISLSPEQLRKGVVAASTGNHGMAVSCAASRLQGSATIYMANGAAPEKVALIQSYGGQPVFHGTNPVDAEYKAREVANASGRVFISPYNDPQIIAGQGTVAVEMHRQHPALDAVFVAVGGGGLISGIGSYLKSVNPKIEVIACWPENSHAMYDCMRAGHVVDVPEEPTISDSTAGGVEDGAVTVDLCRQVVDDTVLVSEAEIFDAMRLVMEKERWLIEGAGAVPVAAFINKKADYAGKNVALVICGRNIPFGKLQKVMQNVGVAA
jgi:threonine dehydratase